MRNILTCDSITVCPPPKSSLRVFYSRFFLFSPCHKHTYIHLRSLHHSWIYSTVVVSACGAFDIHGYACSSRMCVCVEKRLFSSAVVYPPPPSFSCLVSSLHSLYHICILYIYNIIYVGTLIVFLHLHCRHHCVVDQQRIFTQHLTFFFSFFF